jgi:hypothetical protein
MHTAVLIVLGALASVGVTALLREWADGRTEVYEARRLCRWTGSGLSSAPCPYEDILDPRSAAWFEGFNEAVREQARTLQDCRDDGKIDEPL